MDRREAVATQARHRGRMVAREGAVELVVDRADYHGDRRGRRAARAVVAVMVMATVALARSAARSAPDAVITERRFRELD